MEVLGAVVSDEGLDVSPDKLTQIQSWPTP